ncbi:hypothetical protein NYZ99_09980 [Maribacter litopenaei]|uniref:Uncharacterized protein n=1 Tax=Maribacter litopenaei TaxID=2976127 RepID=A0ABY5YDT5_9FLAO|nr:hypothetical protein [Maribacter litopenaei]UWX56477.1 hypothetical protein NYZ99_09980 [Maribacter litopenaei]
MAGPDDDFNRVYAVDGKWGIGNKAEVNGFFAKSVTPSIDGKDYAFKLLANYEWDGWNLNAGYTEVAPGFNPKWDSCSVPPLKNLNF